MLKEMIHRYLVLSGVLDTGRDTLHCENESVLQSGWELSCGVQFNKLCGTLGCCWQFGLVLAAAAAVL